MRKFEPCIIADADLEAYLADKLTTKPEYPFDTEVRGTITSRQVEARNAAEKARKAQNDRNNPKRR